MQKAPRRSSAWRQFVTLQLCSNFHHFPTVADFLGCKVIQSIVNLFFGGLGVTANFTSSNQKILYSLDDQQIIWLHVKWTEKWIFVLGQFFLCVLCVWLCFCVKVVQLNCSNCCVKGGPTSALGAEAFSSSLGRRYALPHGICRFFPVRSQETKCCLIYTR